MCGSGKGGSTNTSTQTPPDYLNNAYQSLVSQAQSTASTPFNPSSVPQVAPLNSTQGTAFGEVAGAQGAANPYIKAANGAIGASQTPVMNGVQSFSPSNIQSYENPYQSDVINATEAEINQTNAQQQSQLKGNAVSQGALGGDRAGIAAAALANQQGLAANQTLAQLNNQNYSQAETELNTQQQLGLGANEAQGWLASQAGAQYGNLGNEALNSQLTGAQALLATGNQQQGQAQSELNYPATIAQDEQAYPFQTNQYLANILEGIGGVGGGTASSTTGGGSAISQILGSLTSGAGILGQTGAFKGGSGSSSSSNGWLTNLFGSSGSGTPSSVPIDGGDSVPIDTGSSVPIRRGGVVPQRRASGGGIFGSMGAARHLAPRVNIGKTPDLLKVPKFDDGGSVTDDIGGLTPSASTASPTTQNYYSQISQYPVEKLQELAARTPPNSPQYPIVMRALQQKQVMPTTAGSAQSSQGSAMQAPTSAATAALQTPSLLMQQGALNSGGVSRETFDDGGATVSLSDGDEEPINGMGSGNPAGIAASTAPQGRFQPPVPEKVDPWSAVTQAGLAIMSGTSRDPLVNIGRGAQVGLQAYEKNKNDASERTYRTGQIDDAVDKLNQEADFHKDTINSEQAKLDLEKNKEQSQSQYQQGVLGVDQSKASTDAARAADEAKYHQGLLDWRNKQLGKNPDGKSGATESLANRIMDDTSDENGNPTISFAEALSRAKASGANATQSTKEDGILKKNAVDLFQSRTVNEDTGKPYTMKEALGFYGVSPQTAGGASATAPTSTAPKNQQNVPPPPPPIGATVKGWKFMGGDPSQQSNWTKATP